MKAIHDFATISEWNAFNNHETLHPLVSVMDFSKAGKRRGYRANFGLYCITLKAVKCGDLGYGRGSYDYQEGTLVFFSPGQVIDVTNKTEAYQPLGHGLAFHPDLLLGTPLAQKMHEYHFFSYQANEALHLSESEKRLVLDCFSKTEQELRHPIDKHSKQLIVSNIELLLNYCERFYDRQFITRENINKGILERFEGLLNDYFVSDKPEEMGLPSVAYFADELHLSPNYFGDLIKKETGRSAQEYIQHKIIDIAKSRLFDDRSTINEIAYQLGFKYPQHFIRLFKKQIGQTPHAYRNAN
ncbi:MAG: helix-turn-helix transcriptional regulator [Lewinella sp.]|nr:helix-turn-helix transcriptional regulator [Lewinella sp.]